MSSKSCVLLTIEEEGLRVLRKQRPSHLAVPQDQGKVGHLSHLCSRPKGLGKGQLMTLLGWMELLVQTYRMPRQMWVCTGLEKIVQKLVMIQVPRKRKEPNSKPQEPGHPGPDLNGLVMEGQGNKQMSIRDTQHYLTKGELEVQKKQRLDKISDARSTSAVSDSPR
jgi:hypothetical protein